MIWLTWTVRRLCTITFFDQNNENVEIFFVRIVSYILWKSCYNHKRFFFVLWFFIGIFVKFFCYYQISLSFFLCLLVVSFLFFVFLSFLRYHFLYSAFLADVLDEVVFVEKSFDCQFHIVLRFVYISCMYILYIYLNCITLFLFEKINRSLFQ